MSKLTSCQKWNLRNKDPSSKRCKTEWQNVLAKLPGDVTLVRGPRLSSVVVCFFVSHLLCSWLRLMESFKLHFKIEWIRKSWTLSASLQRQRMYMCTPCPAWCKHSAVKTRPLLLWTDSSNSCRRPTRCTWRDLTLQLCQLLGCIGGSIPSSCCTSIRCFVWFLVVRIMRPSRMMAQAWSPTSHWAL